MLFPARPTLTMNRALMPTCLLRLLLVGGLAGFFFAATAVQAQTAAGVSALPATPATSLANPNSLPAPIAGIPSGGSPLQHHRARVSYADGLLDVRADNSSLNQILRDISRSTGMRIVGGVPDQRIFGNYGPASPSTVLQTLLDGTNTNMLLKETADGGPAELVLTPQTGGITPPGPNSASYDETETEPELALPGAAQPGATAQPTISTLQPGVAVVPATSAATASTTPTNTAPPVMPSPRNNVYGSPNNVSPTASTLPVVHSVPTDSLPTPSTAQPPQGIVSAPNPPPSYSTTAGFTSQTPASSNPNNPPPGNPATTPAAVKTPQQIYEELQQLQQQKQSNQQPPSSQPASPQP